MSKTTSRKSDARTRLVKTAERLFYAEGINSVGIDRIIAEAEVAKMTLYNHFPSKDDLILAVLKYREEKFDGMLNQRIEHHLDSGLDPVEAFFSALKDWFEGRNFRGCMFINTNAELADPKHEASVFAAAHKQSFRDSIEQTITETYGKSAASKVSSAILLLVEGAIVSAVMQQSASPADTAKEAALMLLAKFKKK